MAEINKEVFRDILISPEEVVRDLKSLIEKAKYFLKIEEDTGNVRLSTEYKFTNAEKISLLLIGKYFVEKLGLISSTYLNFKQISQELVIKETTLTWPLGELIKQNKVEKTSEGYRINQYMINKILEDLIKRHGKVENVFGE